jgi:hypothetical protein
MLNEKEEASKYCGGCKVTKSLKEFAKNAKRSDGLQVRCRACNKEYRQKHVEKTRAYNNSYHARRGWETRLIREYGVEEGWYSTQMLAQSGLCAVCSCPTPYEGLVVDHNHTTGKVRQLLCHTCNKGLGVLESSSTWLIKALAYLETHYEEERKYPDAG